MARNIEIKARISRVSDLIGPAAALADHGPTEILQDDTFFTCHAGRLKLRAFSNSVGELIFYQRSNQGSPKESFYVRTPTAAPDSLRDTLTLAYGAVGRVRKHRTLFIAGRTRIHLDSVEDLGDFLELEVVLEDGEPPDSGIRAAHRLMQQLGITPSQLIDRAYVDLLNEARAHQHKA